MAPAYLLRNLGGRGWQCAVSLAAGRKHLWCQSGLLFAGIVATPFLFAGYFPSHSHRQRPGDVDGGRSGRNRTVAGAGVSGLMGHRVHMANGLRQAIEAKTPVVVLLLVKEPRP